jgi:VWFA-related protein
MKPSRFIIATIATQLVLGVNASILAQTIPSNPNPAPAPLVRLNLIVTDNADHSQDDVGKGDIKVFEDKVEQSLLLFERDERPVDYGIVIDASGSFRSVMRPALEAVSLIISNNRPFDETFIERFVSVDKIEVLRGFTGDKNVLLSTLKSIKVEGGQSAVVDALYLAIDYSAKHAKKERRQALVFITDGEDRHSFYQLEDIVTALHKTNIQVFVIGMVFMLDQSTSLVRLSRRDEAEKLLSTIAKESGGRLFYAENLGDLTKAVIEINHDLQTQFAISYQPTNREKTGFRKLEVKVVERPGRKKWRAIAPLGYYLNPQVADSKSKAKNP